MQYIDKIVCLIFSNSQDRWICRKESRTKENDNLSILPNFITFSVVI